MYSYALQDNRVTDHRLKMNFELTSFLDGDMEMAVQVHSHDELLFQKADIFFSCLSHSIFVNIKVPAVLMFLFVQSCAAMEQKELLEELAESVGAMAR